MSDPALAAIQAYRALNADWHRLCAEFDEAGGSVQPWPRASPAPRTRWTPLPSA